MQTVVPRWIISLTAIVLLVAACGTTAVGSSETTTTTQSAPTTTQATISTTAASTTTTETTTTTAPLVFENGVGKVGNIAFLEMNDYEYRADVYVPEGEGPWPVVVALHGATVFKGHETNTAVARAAAEAGMVVFAPNWVKRWPPLSDMDAEWMRNESPVLPCALAFAQQEAARYGGDSTRTVVYGISGGATAGAQWVFGPKRDLTSGCLTQTPPLAPIGAVLGDAEYFRHATWWDGAFDEDLEELQKITAETVDPAFWNNDLPERILVWAAENGSFPRSFDDPWDDDGWFAQRDPDGTIRQDLDELGELDDGVITYVDEGLLLAHRLQQAGIDATFEILPGGHTSVDKVPEIVAYLLDAAGTP